jgi:hypothetical protein
VSVWNFNLESSLDKTIDVRTFIGKETWKTKPLIIDVGFSPALFPAKSCNSSGARATRCSGQSSRCRDAGAVTTPSTMAK